jgi:hypothetical protein
VDGEPEHGGNAHTNVGTPVASTDEANKAYYDNKGQAFGQWQQQSAPATTSARFMFPGAGNVAPTPTENLSVIIAPCDGVLRALYVFHGGTLLTTDSITYTVRVNATTDTALVATVAANTSSASIAGQSVPVKAGDRITIRMGQSGTQVQANLDVAASVLWSSNDPFQAYGPPTTIVDANLWDSHVATPQTAVPTAGGYAYTVNEAFARIVLTTDAPSIVVCQLNDAGTPPDLTVARSGLILNGVNQGSGFMPPNDLGEGRHEYIFSPASGGVRTVQIVQAPPSDVGAGVLRGIKMRYFQLPRVGYTANVVAPSAPAKRYVLYADSIGAGVDGSNVCWPYEAWTILMRQNMLASSSGSMAGGSVIIYAVPGWDFASVAGSPALVTATIAKMTAQFDGTVTNRFIIALGTNDWSAGLSAATIASYLGALLTAMATAFPAVDGIVITPTTRIAEAIPNAGGSTLQDVRNAMTAECALHANVATVLQGPSLVTFPGNFSSDFVHPSPAGYVQYEAGVRAVAGY